MPYFSHGYSRFVFLLLALFIASVLAGIGYSSHQERAAQLAFQLQRAQGSALAVEDQISQTFQLIENLVQTLPELSDVPLHQVQTPAHTQDLTRLLLRLQHGQPALRSLSFLRAGEGIKASTNPDNVGVVLPIDAFVPPDNHASGAAVLRLGTLRQGRDLSDSAPGSSYLPLVLRLGEGQQAVWVLAALNPDYLLSRMQRYTHAETDQFDLVRFDGETLIGSIEGANAPHFSWAELLPEIQRNEIGTHAGAWLTAYRSSSRYPFFVAIRVDSEAVLTQWTANFWSLVSWTVAALCAVLAVSVVLMRQLILGEKLERQHKTELLLSRDKAEAATQAKSQFLANMSHEIRTPMSAVIGMTQLALEEPMPDQAKRFVSSAHRAAVSLLGILNDILDFSKIEAGKLEIESVPFNLHQLLTDLVTLQRLMAEDKGLSLTLSIEPSTPAWIQSDPLRVTQILNNLLANAIKFTAHGQVEIRVSATQSKHLHVVIRDEGVGMTPEQVSQLFKPFSQADSSTTRIYGGTGLGLAICKQLCDRMNAHIHVRSQLGVGSSFTVDLPFLLASPAETSAALPVLPVQQDFAGARLLLAEDHVLNRQLLLALLKKVNVDVHIASNGEEVLDMLTQSAQPFDLILMDIQMPVMDGITATRHIRSDNRFNDLPIIAVTANAMSDERAMCLAAGMQDYLLKPLDRETLFACLGKWIRRT
ncbi:MAG: ATP-binding protein [Limnohabitans sp.]